MVIILLGIVILALCVFTYMFLSKAAVMTIVNKNKVSVKGELSQITQSSPGKNKSLPSYKAKLAYTTKSGETLKTTYSQDISPYTFLQENIKKPSAEVTVYYNKSNPKLFYIKELSSPSWRYYLVGSIFAGFTAFLVYLTVTLYQ